ncbi:uncharacterized protein LOC119677652 [Teleopsis dalmanni]|uniref:uncharacterized protein LOC119677652 n=1 Tax=Teleopsis dalmanni TaxID=139649 RepID=UPI0018CCDEAA|nr:uncharacterized protein LOC119677652 [Teleopsis dalmanni]
MDQYAASTILDDHENKYSSLLAVRLVISSGEGYFIKKLSFKKCTKQFTASREVKKAILPFKKPVERKSDSDALKTEIKFNMSDVPSKFHSFIFVFDNEDTRYENVTLNKLFRGKHNSSSIFGHSDKGSLCSYEISAHDDVDVLRRMSYSFRKATMTKRDTFIPSNMCENKGEGDQKKTGSHKILLFEEKDTYEPSFCYNDDMVKKKNDNLIPFAEFATNEYQFPTNKNALSIFCEKSCDFGNKFDEECIQFTFTITNNFNDSLTEMFSVSLKASMSENICFTDGMINSNVEQSSLNHLILNIFKYLHNNQRLQIQDKSAVHHELLSTSGKLEVRSATLPCSLKAVTGLPYWSIDRTGKGCNATLARSFRAEIGPQYLAKYFSSMVKNLNVDKRLLGTKGSQRVLLNIELKPKQLKVQVENTLLARPVHFFAGTVDRYADITRMLRGETPQRCLKVKPPMMSSLSEKNMLVNKSICMNKTNKSELKKNVCPATLPKDSVLKCKEVETISVNKENLFESEGLLLKLIGTMNLWSMLFLLKAMVGAFAYTK